MALERRVQQSQVHRDRVAIGAQAVRGQQSRQPVGPLLEFVAGAEFPGLRARRIRERSDSRPPRDIAAHHHGERIVEAQRAQPFQPPLLLVSAREPAAITAAGSFDGGSFSTAVSAVPLYSG